MITSPTHVPSAPTSLPAALRLARGAERLRSSEIRDLLRVTESAGVLSLAGGLPAPESLPAERVAIAAERAMRVAGRYGPLALQYGPTEGVDALRVLLAAGTAASPAFADPDRIIVTTGSQQGLDLVARAMLDPRDVIAVEDPIYLGARQVFAAHGARAVGIPIDQDGLDTDRLAAQLAAGLRPRLLYTVPNFSNPSGATLSRSRRHGLARLASEYGFLIVEDDPYHALAFDGATALPAIGTLAPDHVVTLGSASKMIAPGLRVGWLHAPRWLASTLARAKQTLDLHTATLPQLIALDLLSDDEFMRVHVATVRARSAARAHALHRALAGVVDAPLPKGGMFLWGRTAVDTRLAFRAAIEGGVAYVPGDAFTVDRDGTNWLRVSFATLDVADLHCAAARLRIAFTAVDSGATTLPG